VTLNLVTFVAAALLEIAGCFAFWIWLRQGRSPASALRGVLSLVAFAAMLTRVDAAFAGRAYAALRRNLHCSIARRHYSVRRATIGSMRAARRAGRRPAHTATSRRTTIAAVIASGSFGVCW
jgi:hypothetical protein